MAADDTIQVVIRGRSEGVRSAAEEASAAVGGIKTAAEDAAGGLRRAGERAEAAARRIGSGMRDAADATGHMGQEMRHVIALFDEFNRNARGQMIASSRR